MSDTVLKASLIIPVWNGAQVLPESLDAVTRCSGAELLEIICVDNCSRDESAQLIASRYPQVHLLRQPVNLGFAGGVNSGIEAARGDVLVLLNQDCIVQPGWLSLLLEELNNHSEFGIVGCRISNADGTLNHAGAVIRRPDGYGMHLTDEDSNQTRSVESVTGAAMAIRRETWTMVGRFDEGFYPAYYEDSDYCYRARSKGIQIGYAPSAHVIHLFSSREWQVEPIRHTANQHFARYRFVCKHFEGSEFGEFFKAESKAIKAEEYLDQTTSRVIAARDLLRGLPDILERRRIDLDNGLAPALRRELQVGFTEVLRQSFAKSREMIRSELDADVRVPVVEPGRNESRSLSLKEQEEYLLAQIQRSFPADARSERWFNKLMRVSKRAIGIVSGREIARLVALNAIQKQRLGQFVEQRVKLLEALADYEYR